MRCSICGYKLSITEVTEALAYGLETCPQFKCNGGLTEDDDTYF
jgi:hypothetical protein